MTKNNKIDDVYETNKKKREKHTTNNYDNKINEQQKHKPIECRYCEN